MEIQNDCVVAIHYTLTNAEGDVIDSSQGRDPLKYLHGYGNIIRGLEQALAGKTVGEALNVVIEAVDAYGEREEDLVQEVLHPQGDVNIACTLNDFTLYFVSNMRNNLDRTA